MGDVMVSNIMTHDVSVAGNVKAPEVEKLSLVSTVQKLPQDGKKLPRDDTKQTEKTRESIEQAVQNLNDHAQLARRQLEFSIDDKSGRTVITVRDKDSQEIIRQIPGEEALRYARNLQQGDEPGLFDKFV